MAVPYVFYQLQSKQLVINCSPSSQWFVITPGAKQNGIWIPLYGYG
jgi:hypothetical protein